ncbi:MAG TPA: hypothetical protein VFT09_00295 [Ilumatobacteraceae bacterium]|nr:hypothetical protein [Ilumatobacteraceae bacterium]
MLGLTPRTCFVDVAPTIVVARMGWSFRTTIERAAITAVRDDTDRVLGWGAHGWRGVWLLNGSSHGIVRVDIEPPARAWVVGFRIRLRALRVALEDPAGFQAALTASR